MIAALFSVFACAKEEKEFQRINVDGPGVYAAMDPIEYDGPDTKATVNESTLAYEWEPGDQINIWSNVGTLLVYTVTETNGERAKFDGGGFTLTDGETYYSSHPLISSPKDKYTSLPTSYVGQKQTGNNNADHLAEYMYTYTSATCTNQNTSFQYHHLSSYIIFNVTLPTANMTVKELTLSAGEELFALDGTADMTSGAFTPGSKSNTIKLDLENVTVTDGKLIAFMSSAPFAAGNVTVQVKDAEDKVYTSPLTYLMARNAGQATRLSVNVYEGEEIPVAQIGDVQYTTLEAAFAAVPADGTPTTITLLNSTVGSGVKSQAGQNIVLDFNGKTYTVDKTVGSTGTETLGMQLNKGSVVTLKNGKLTSTTALMLVQNYCDLTLEDMTLDGTLAPDCSYVLSNNCGEVNIIGSSSILAAPGMNAFDVCWGPNNGYPEGTQITVNTTGKIDGIIEYDLWGANAMPVFSTLSIKDGNFVNYAVSLVGPAEFKATAEENIQITGGIFDVDPSEYVAEGYAANLTDEGKYVVEQIVVASVNGVGYSTLTEAIDAATDGSVISLLSDYDATSEPMTGGTRQFVINKNLTIDGQGHTLTTKQRGFGVGNVNGDVANNIDVTFKDITIKNTSSDARCIDTRGKIGTLTLDNVTLSTDGASSGYTQPLTIGGNQSDIAKVNITNSTIQTNEAGTAYYAIITFNPVNMTVSGSTLKGWACIYAKGKNSSAGSAGSVINIDDSDILSVNEYNGSSNAFAAFKIEDDNVTINVTNSDFEIKGLGDQYQALASDSDAITRGGVNLGEGNTVTLTGKTALGYSNTELYVSGGIFNVPVPQVFCAEGYVPKNLGDGTYTVVPRTSDIIVNGTSYETLNAAITAAESGEVVTLFADYDATSEPMTGGTRQFVINKNLTIDGQGHTLTTKERGFGVGNVNGDVANNIDVTFKDITIKNTSSGARCIDTRGKIGTLTLDNVTLSTDGAASSGYTQPLTIGGNQSDIAKVNITNSTIQTNEAGTAYYAIITFNPVNMTVSNSTLKGWACIYAKGPDSSAGSAGSTFSLDGCTLESKNIYSSASNSFGAIVIEDNNVGVDIINSQINIHNTGNQNQDVVIYTNSQLSGNHVELGTGNTLLFDNSGSGSCMYIANQGSGSTFTISSDIFDEQYVPAGYTANQGDGSYTIVMEE